MSEIPTLNAIVLVSGTDFGAGQTTVSEYIANTYNLPHIYAGLKRREMASALEAHLGNGGSLDEFRIQLESSPSIHNTTHLRGQTFNEEFLGRFNDIIARPENTGLKKVVEYIIDESSAAELAKGEAKVIEGKLAVRIDAIIPRPEYNTLSIPIVRILLVAPPIEITARRIHQRRIDKGEISDDGGIGVAITRSMLEQRRADDWQRYRDTYGIEPDFLRVDGINVVDGGKPLDEVLKEVRKIIEKDG